MKLVLDLLIFVDKKAYGYQEYIFNLLEYFHQNREMIKFEKIIIACRKDQEDYFSKYSDKFRISSFDIKNKLDHLVIQSSLEIKLNLCRDDVVLSTYNYSGLIKRCKSVLVVHDLLFMHKGLLKNTFMRWQRKFYLPLSIRKADKIIAISNYTKKELECYYTFSKDKSVVIYNYFDLANKFGKTSDFIPCSTSYFVTICSSAHHKNTINVLKAFKEYAEKDSMYDLVLVGALSDRTSEAFIYYYSLPDEIKARLHILENISNDQLGQVYRKSSLFISLTLFEGLGMPIVEAMYFDLPLLLSNIDVCREVSNDTGLYVNPYDIDETAKKMMDFAENPFKAQTRALVEQKYSHDNTCLRYIDLLNGFV